ncbi:MAG TPA: D-2-hydroxyacid dehydrogenase [Pirellulales bacterium]|nr:D-2-hydroxyacid dehydrogenase [Pirellulales bacterium]
MRIVLCYPVEAKHLARIAAVAPDAELVDAGQERIAEEILEADIYCGHAKVHPIPWEKVVRRGRLKWIQSSAAGMDHCLMPSVVESEITVSSASGVLADQVAEHTLALATGLLRSLPVFFRAQQKKEFIRRPTRDLHRATIGIVGFGGNGRRLAEVLRVFEGRILATDMFPVERPEYVEALWPPERLHDLLSQSKIVILAAPLTATTRGMIDAAALAAMQPGSILINVARGPLVVESALVEALRSGHLAGAGLDVTEVEPLPPDSPLWELPQVIITPHVGGQSATRIDDMTYFFCENLRRWLSGRPPLNLIDKRLGFPVWHAGSHWTQTTARA